MPERILVCVAWPYANGSIHIGQLGGAYLPPDIFARYHRTLGNEVLMVSGSDQHGTPITVRAEQEGRSPGDIAAEFQAEFLETWKGMGIGFDLFTTTGTDNHARISQEMFAALLESGDIYKGTMDLPFCVQEQRFLLDRYVEGTCPICNYDGARGDQCDNCGNVLDPIDLKNRRCKFDGSEPEIRESEHFFHRLSAYNQAVREWLKQDKSHWRRNVLNLSISTTETGEGLKDRAITRDLTWGIPIPLEGYDDKRIYVWFEAVIGYLSASIEWAEKRGEPDRWRDYWLDPASRSYYFIGKDNIWFHTLIWPAQLMGYAKATGDSYNLPYDVPANQYVTIKGSKASTSRRMAVWVPDFLTRYDPDPLRYYLTAIAPETSDSDFTWSGFVQRNNDELVATWGNLVNRVLTFTYRNFDQRVPEPGELTDADRELLSTVEQTLTATGDAIAACNFRTALELAMAAARDANRYLEDNAPWKLIKQDRERCATVLWIALAAVSGLKVAFYPFLPFTCEKLHGYLGGEGPLGAAGWKTIELKAATPLLEPQPLFKKLDPEIIELEDARLGGLMLTDSHCHLQDKKLAPDLDEVTDRARESGVTTIVTIGYDMPSSHQAVMIAGDHDDIFATVGVHPHDARSLTETDLTTLGELAKSDRVVGIGEIGLDFYRNLSPPDDQYRAFRDQLSLARDLQLPVVIHSRDADEQVFEVLATYAGQTSPQWPADRPPGVMHCFAGDLPLAQRYMELGFIISIAATVTYPTAERTREVAASIPLDRMTIETDAPYLPPQSIRGQRNEPARVRDVAEFVAQLRGIPFDEVAGETANTAARLYGLG